MKKNKRMVISLLAAAGLSGATVAQQASITADFNAPQTEVSKNLFGIFYEDINYAADGGLYGEMVQNRSFEFGASNNSATTGWKDHINKSGEKSASRLKASKKGGLNANNPTYATFTAKAAGDGFSNKGYKGMYFEAGKTYPGSVYLRSQDASVTSMTITIGADDSDAKTASVKIDGITSEWKKYEFSLTAAANTFNGCISLYADQAGKVDVDFVSLFMADIYKNEPNGLRKDLAEMLEAMHPAFIRFPGGCIVHGHFLADRYQWKNTVGPVEERKETPNFWGGVIPYQQSYGIGFYEYFRLCEDLGAEPIPVLSVGMSHDGEKSSTGEYKWYAQDALDMIEWATGPATSKWGKVRAEAGHPEPFKLNYIGIGNEDCGGDYLARFQYIASAIKKQYPNIKTIISSGFTYNDINFNNAWNQVKQWEKNKKTKNLTNLVDEHYYNPYTWFLTNGGRYDDQKFYPRGKDAPKVFIGEYASWVDGRRNSLFAALTEAAYMTSIERNGDVIEIASYAPLFARDGFVQWQPDAIWFDNSQVYGTPNYYVQQMFMTHKSDYTVKTSVTQPVNPDAKKKGIEGTVGIGSWATTANFKDIKVTNNDNGKVIYSSNGVKDTNDFSVATQRGEWEIEKGNIVQKSMATPAFMALDNESDIEGMQNYTYELQAQKTGGAEGFLISFGVKGENLYWWNMGGWGNTQSCIEKGTLGGRSIIGDSKPMTLANNKWYKIKIEVKGESYKCYLDGKLMHEFTDVQNFDPLYAHVGRTNDGKIIMKIVNVTNEAQNVKVNLKGAKNLGSSAKVTLITGGADDENSFRVPKQVAPTEETFNGVAEEFTYPAKPFSLSILEIDAK
ncbi:MAG: hypothetical protein IJ630_11555 [Treponema sp.]|nr:hypothetical protein [Treponema sp.]